MSYNESLRSNSNYPQMSQSEWDNAPWNEPSIPEKEFDVEVSFTMRKVVTVTTDDYTPEFDEEDGHIYDNTENTDWDKAYNNSCHTIQELLRELENYVKEDIERHQGCTTKVNRLKRLLEDCQQWEIEDVNYEEQ